MKTMIGTLPAALSILLALPSYGQAQGEQKEVALSHEARIVSLETIRSAYTEGRDKDVLLLADRAFLEVSLGGELALRAAELHFWRGAALRRMGRHEEALIALVQAGTLGFQGSELHLERGLTHRTLGQEQEAERDYQEAEKRLLEDPDKRERLALRWKWDGKEQPRFQLWISPQVGYDSNLIGLDKDTPLTQGDVDFDSMYVGAYLDVKHFLVMNESQLLWLQFQNLSRQYPGESDVSFTDSVLSLAGRQPLLERVDVEARAAVEEAFLKDEGHFRTQRTLGSALLLQPFHDLQVRIWADWTDADYYGPQPGEQDRDGKILRGGLRLAIDAGRNWSVSPFFTVNRYSAEGADYESSGWEIGFSVAPPEFAGFRIASTVSYGEQTYDNPNSLTGFAKKREDHPILLSITIAFRQLESLIGYAPNLGVTFERHRSNIGDFDYSRWNPQIEMGIAALTF